LEKPRRSRRGFAVGLDLRQPTVAEGLPRAEGRRSDVDSTVLAVKLIIQIPVDNDPESRRREGPRNVKRLWRHLAVVLCSAFAAWPQTPGPAGDWPQWRGPHLDGSNRTCRHLPTQWSETENVVWRTRLPSWAAATPIIWGDTVFVTSADEGYESLRHSGIVDRVLGGLRAAWYRSDRLLLLALDRKTGLERWRAVVGNGNETQTKQNMASPSPVTDGRRVWVMTGRGTLTCLTFAGKQVWQRDIGKEHGEIGVRYGYGSSPLLAEGRLYVQVLRTGLSYVLALDGDTGEALWRVERPTDAVEESPDSYSTPTLANVRGKTQLIVSGGGYVTGHDLGTGREMWRGGGLDPDKATDYRTIASTLVVRDVALVPSRRRPFIAFRLDGEGPVPQRLWSTDLGPDVPTPTTDGERLYIVDDRGIALCLRVMDGTTVWERRRLEPGSYLASPLLADGKVYATNEDGETTVFKAGDRFEILSVNTLKDHTLASPAAAGENIFIRTANYLYCLGKQRKVSD